MSNKRRFVEYAVTQIIAVSWIERLVSEIRGSLAQSMKHPEFG